MELVAFLPLLFVRMSLFALWNASPSRQTQREEYNSENVIDLLEALNVTRGGVRGVSKVKGPEAGLVAWRFRSRTPHLMLPREHALYLLSSAHGSLGLHLIGQQARQTTATLLSLMSHGQTLLRLVSCTRSNTLRLEYPTHTHTHSDTHTHTHSHSDTHTHSLLLPGGSPFSGGGWVQLALGLEAHRVALFINCREEEVVELSQPDEVINLRLPMDLQVTFASDAEDPNSKFSGSWQTAEMSTRAYQSRPWTCPNLTEPLPPPTPRSEMLQTEGSISPIMLLDERVGVANDQPQRVVLGAPGRRAQSPTHTSANAETLPQTLPLTHTHTLTHTSHGERIGRLEERLDGVNTMLEMLKNQNVELAERVRSLEECECVKRVCVWEDAEVESGKSWETDTHSLCTCTNGQVHCSTPYECVYDGKTYRAGEEFQPDSCSSCVCKSGQMNCIRVSCSSLSCRDQYIPDRECCPVCRSGCEYEEVWYENGDVFVSPGNPCLNCSCTNNLAKCVPIQCSRPRCSNPFQPLGECCPTCTACDLEGRPDNNTIISTLDGCQTCACQNGAVSCDVIQRCTQRCVDEGLCCAHQPGLVLLDGVAFPDPRDSCRRCVCTKGDVVCAGVSCPTLDCSLVETVGGACCPRCRSCVLDGIWHEHGSQWKHPDNPCSVCTCAEGQVRCERRDCNPPCPYPSSPRPGTCCPVCIGCGVNGLDFLNGDRVPSGDRCEECVCANGDLRCKPLPCPATPCARPIKRPRECCPRCEQCEYESQVYADGQSFPSRTDPCVSCHCSAGEVVCDRLDSQCPDVRCSHPAKPHGHCCASCEMCEYERQLYADGEVFNPPGSGPCAQCTCKRGSVRCHKQRCPPVPCANPIRDPQLCCPVCKVCLQDGVELEEGSEWERDCNRCVCQDGEVVCRSAHCPPVTCQHPTKMNGDCCVSCERCSYNNRIYENGRTFTDPEDACHRCMCQDGTVECTVIDCPRLTCSNPSKPPGQCCPRCQDCNFEKRVFVNGEQFPNPLQPCQECVCVDGVVDCKTHQCPTPTCHNPLPASCCQNNCNGCSYAGKEYPNGAEFPHPTDKCRTCHCINGNVRCLMKRCPALHCIEPVSVPGECCPQCPAPPANCVYVGQTYMHTQRFYHPTDSCQSCSCTNGTVSCVRKPCPPALCVHPIQQDCCRTCDGCMYDGTEHPNGGVFADVSDPCGVCVCREGTVACERKRCPLVTCPHPIQRECCQNCDGCLYVGVEYQSGQEFPAPASRCSVCVCVNGRVTCSPKPCYNPGCTHPVTLPGHCCPVCDGCFYDNAVMLNGQGFPDARDSCSECTCRAGSVQCLRRVCPTALCPHPVSGPCDCPVCEGCVFQGGVYADGQSFPAPKADCDVCTCSRGGVTCAPQVCAKVSCPHPALDRCSCGVCDGCLFHQRNCGNGERFPHPQDPCQRCTCLNGGVSCVSLSCPAVVCAQPVTPSGECCPACTGVCEHLGRVHDSRSTFTHPNDRCSTCTCLNEVVSCKKKPCGKQCTHSVATRDCCPVCDACVYDGRDYTHKQSFTPRGRPCERCVCVSGSVTCSPRSCPVLSCPNTHTPPGHCCPECRVCSQNGVKYSEGQTWNPTSDPCQKCTCAFGEVVCVGPQCPALTCTNQLTDPDSCCPHCRGCVYNGVEHTEGSDWFDSGSPCMSCMCVEGVTTCSELRCLSPCTHTINVPGECCPVCADCIYGDKLYGPGDSFHPEDDPCQICVCEVMPDGEQHLRCIRKQCPSLVDCPKENILFSSESCCPVCAQPLSNCTATLIGNEVLATDDPCFTCQCKDLTWTCIHQTCVPLTCPPHEQYTPPDSCCAVCDECLIEGGRERVPNRHRWTDSTNECITCTCNLGYIECEIEECVPLVCDDGWVQVKPPGKCCYECQDSGAACEYQGEVYVSNEHWEEDECTSCTCVSGEVHCQTERCPPTNCAADETPALIPGMCCPHCLPRPATCIAFGDPHYRSFDGRMVNFQGSCTYVLTEDCHGGDFSIHVTNDARGRKGVSWTKEVTLFIADITVSLLQNWVVMVDSEVVSLPYLKEPYVYIERKTNTILLNTNIGLKVQWNGRSHLEVSVPGTYKKRTCGLCGNFNNYQQDDLRLRSGQTTSSEAAFGNNWRVGGANSSACVLEAEDVSPCRSAGYSARKSANARCAVLKGSMFEPCHKVVPPEMFYAACVYDLCACGANSEECVCDALEAYASECREAGVKLQWRSSSLCAVGCPVDRGFVFDECGPPCAVTCVTRAVPLGVIEARCFKPCVPGCQCPAGRVLHDNHCIHPDKCPKVIHNTT
ncbi:kielin/chordin-like protein [Clupea harengus]|uniref:Kielin/chordin-like protein n=1 Tax=Clupea harengus TaxID=7950 RepID=A0A6P8F4L3_CLUHA|nr:kielin/chordin-like protein [Clupea harengus]